VAVEVLTGKMPGVPKPDCVLLVLDATHLNRQLMLAAPVFSIGLPTLVLLNMATSWRRAAARLIRWRWPRSWGIRWR
jgi:ferrous iron transport protein B